jgi:hypothetical protein
MCRQSRVVFGFGRGIGDRLAVRCVARINDISRQREVHESIMRMNRKPRWSWWGISREDVSGRLVASLESRQECNLLVKSDRVLHHGYL